jgi:hypothetical protein
VATVSSPKTPTAGPTAAVAKAASTVPPTPDAAPIPPASARTPRTSGRRVTPAAEVVAPRPADPAPTPAARVPWYAARVPNAAPTPAPAATPTLSPRSGAVLQQVEARRATVWVNTKTDDYDASGPDDVPMPAIPGAYLAPSGSFMAPVLRPRPGGLAQVQAATRVASPAYAPSATGAVSAVAFAPAVGAPAAAAPTSAPPTRRAGVSVQAPSELPGWLAIAGSAIGAVSFLMPWSRDGVIGAVGSTYFDRWGLANVGYLPLVVVALLLLAVNGIPNPIPTWVRAGLAPLAIGAILFGLDWAYQTRPYSDGLGVTLLLVGAVVLMAGGLIGVRTGRHQAVPPAV